MGKTLDAAAIGKVKTLIGAAVVAGSMGIVVSALTVKICTQQAGCETFTLIEYSNTREYLADKYLNKEEFTMYEYQAFVAIMDRELKRRNKATLKNVDSKEALMNGLANFMKL